MAGLLGIVVLALYGDRSLYYQDPYNYKGGFTKLTPLGEVTCSSIFHNITRVFMFPADTRVADRVLPTLAVHRPRCPEPHSEHQPRHRRRPRDPCARGCWKRERRGRELGDRAPPGLISPFF